MKPTTSPLIDVSQLSQEQRDAIALRIQVAEDFTLPRLQYWNYELCRKHRFGWDETYFDNEVQDFLLRKIEDRPKPGCQICGIHFRAHQRVGMTWAYLKGRCLIADSVGTGKMITGAGLIAMLKESGEIDRRGRVMICSRPAAIFQWAREMNRLVPSIAVTMVDGSKHSKKVRLERYLEHWEVLLVGPQVLHNDYDVLSDYFQFSTMIVDDVDSLRNRDTQTAVTVKKFGRTCDRMVVLTGTPLQKRLQEMHSVLDPLGGLEIFGSERQFLNRYTQQRRIQLYNPRSGRKFTKIEVVGHTHIPEFVQKMSPLVLRRTASDIKDVTLPVIMPNNVWLDLYPAQRAKYKELQTGVIELVKRDGDKITRARATATVHSASMICGGLSFLGEEDGPNTSSKLDWVMENLTGDLVNEKVVIFVKYLAGVRALQSRLANEGIGHVTIWGEEPDKAVRARSQETFWTDDNCRVLVGTTAIEQSLNFQCARHLINVDMIANPARMEQLVGRIRRDGSEFPHVYVHNLLTNDTHEMRLLPKLEAEQALIDGVWNEKSELFDQLTPLQMMQLIGG